MLAIRLVVSNNSDDVAWTMNTREQRAVVLGASETRPVYANADAGLSPSLPNPAREEDDRRSVLSAPCRPTGSEASAPVRCHLAGADRRTARRRTNAVRATGDRNRAISVWLVRGRLLALLVVQSALARPVLRDFAWIFSVSGSSHGHRTGPGASSCAVVLLPRSWQGRSRSADLAPTQRKIRRGRRDNPLSRRFGRRASPVTLRRNTNSACPVSSSGRMAATMIDRYRETWR